MNMPQPAWRLIVEKMQIPDPQNAQWTQVLDYANPGKLLKIVVIDSNGDPDPTKTWKPKGFSGAGCTADGDYENKGSQGAGTPILSSAPRGALIGRIGGSTADQSADTPAAGTNPSRVIFAVGRFCVIAVPTAPLGALFLGVNDLPEHMGSVAENLFVNIYEAL
jgi:hypothetical protein